MRSAMLYIQAFTPPALHTKVDHDDEHWSLLTLACDISRESLQLKEEAGCSEASIKALLHSTLSFIEVVAWTAPDTISEEYSHRRS